MTLHEIENNILLEGYKKMFRAKSHNDLYAKNEAIAYKYVHSTSRGHEAIQVAMGMQLLPQDFVAPYYRDDAMLIGMNISSYQLMLNLMAKKNDVFSGGRHYYCHPSLNHSDYPKIPFQSSATGMQAIPITGAAMGIKHKETLGIGPKLDEKPVVICSIGDAAMTEGEVSEALHMAALKQLPIIYLVQDNGWDISAKAEEVRANDSIKFASGFEGIETRDIDGSNFIESYNTIKEVIEIIREERRPFLIRATVPLLGHHTSGVQKQWYRDDLEEHETRDPMPKLRNILLDNSYSEEQVSEVENEIIKDLDQLWEKAILEEDPDPKDFENHVWAETVIKEETGTRKPKNGEKVMMVDAALHAVEESMRKFPESLLYGQDVGRRLGGVFREAFTLAEKFGKDRVFNTPIQEAFIIGSTAGMSAVGLKPIVEVQFADYIWPGLNQLFTELSRSNYLSNGQWPVQSLIRVPIGAYGNGGPYHSSSIETILTNIIGVKIIYPSNAADMKGLMKAAILDPNPVVMLEHKGLYWSKIKGTERAKMIEPSDDYFIPIGKARIEQEAKKEEIDRGNSLLIITYGMGVHWSVNASKQYKDRVEIIDLRTIVPLEEDLILKKAKEHGKILVVVEEAERNSFGIALVGWIQKECFKYLDAPVEIIGSVNIPAIPLNEAYEKIMLPNAEKVKDKIEYLLNY
ncbi:MAG: tungsten formylmethanofuran dehydrogenase [Flavobacteriales bacterium]|nr:tungsten formylmethanofuran dehydrogenase [Flavobacteriales bacterium]